MDEMYIEKSLGQENYQPLPLPSVDAVNEVRRANAMFLNRTYIINLLIAVAVLALVGFTLVNRPDIVSRITTSLDVFGFTYDKKAERLRQQAIMDLRIAYEYKQALVNHTVFIGATPQMITLALGNPQKIDRLNPASEIWHYQLTGDNYSTVLTIVDEKLTKADKGTPLTP